MELPGIYLLESLEFSCGVIHYETLNSHEWYAITNQFFDLYGKDFGTTSLEYTEYICLKVEGQIVAIISIEQVNEEISVLSNLFVIPPMRQKGFASKLLQYIFYYNKYKKYVLFVDVNNTDAIELYQKIGFVKMNILLNIE